METRRWTNPTQPQTLQIAVFLLYINAAFGVLFGQFLNPVGLVLIVGEGVSAYFIANERRWGYWLGVGVATLGLIPFVLTVVADGASALTNIGFLINLIFPAALFALLLHPHSRDYQRIWFS